MTNSVFYNRILRSLTITVLCLVVIAVSIIHTPIAHAVDPVDAISYQGRLLNANGVPVSDASLEMVFRFFDASSGGTCLWESDDGVGCDVGDETQTVALTDGLFSENIGSTVDPDGLSEAYPFAVSNIFGDNTNVYLEVEVSGETLNPRKQIVAAPYALNSQTLDGFDSTDLLHTDGGTGTGIYDLTGAVFSGASPFVFEGATANDFETIFSITNPTADQTVTFQNASGTVAYLTDISAGATLWETGLFSTFEDDDDVVIGTSGAETIADGVFSLSGDDLFVSGDVGVEGGIFTDAAFNVEGTILVDDSLAFVGAGTIDTIAGDLNLVISTGALTFGQNTIIGDGGDTISLNTSDWDINTTGDMTGIGAIASDGNFDLSGGDFNVTLDANVGANITSDAAAQAAPLNVTLTGTNDANRSAVTIDATATDQSNRSVGGLFVLMTSLGTAPTDLTRGIVIDLASEDGATDKAIEIENTEAWDTDIELQNDETISNTVDGTIALTATTVTTSAALTIAGTLTSNGNVNLGDGGDSIVLNASGNVFIDDSNITGTGSLNISSATNTGLSLDAPGGGGTITIGSVADIVSVNIASGTASDDITIATENSSPDTITIGSATDTFSIETAEFDVSSTTGSITIDDDTNTGSLTVDGTLLNMTSLTFVGAGSVASGAATTLTLNSGTTGTINIGDDNSNEAISIGTGAGAKSVGLGSTNTTSQTTVQSGTNGTSLNSTGDTTISADNLWVTSADAVMIDGAEFDVSQFTGSINIDDDGNAGQVAVDGAILNRTSLTFFSNGNVLSAAGNAVRLSADGGNAAGETVALEGINAQLTASGALVLSPQLVVVTAIDVTDTDFTTGISLGDNVILGTTSAIDFSEFDVSNTNGSVTINDDANAGLLDVEGTVLNINTLAFLGAGTISSAGAGNDVTLSPADQIILNGGSTVDVQDSLVNSAGSVMVADTLAPDADNTRTLGAAGVGWASIFIDNPDDATVVSLSSDGTAETDSGASAIGTFDEFGNSASGNLQDVLDDLDTAITSGGAGAMWTLTGGVIRPTDATNDFAVGGTTAAASPFGVDESANTIFVGEGATGNGTITFKASDADTGNLSYTTNDRFLFAGGDLTLGSDTIAGVNAAYTADGDDIFTTGHIAAQDNMYADTFVAGDASTTFADGSLTTTGATDFALTIAGGDLTFAQNTTIGDGGDTLVLNTSDWDISATGQMTGIASVITDDNQTTLPVSIGVSGTDVDIHTISFQIDGNAGMTISATGDGAGSVGARTISIGNSAAADIIGIGDGNADVSLTDAQWSISAGGVGAMQSLTVLAGGAGLDSDVAGALGIANTTATSVGMCNSAACDTISVGTNADPDTITIGDTANDTTALNGTTIAISSSDWTIGTTGNMAGIGSLAGDSNATTLGFTIPVAGTDATTHTISLGIDGTPSFTVAATGDGAGGIGVQTIAVGASASADIVNIGDANANITITDVQWNIAGAGTANFVSVGAASAGTGAFSTLNASGLFTASGAAIFNSDVDMLLAGAEDVAIESTTGDNNLTPLTIRLTNTDTGALQQIGLTVQNTSSSTSATEALISMDNADAIVTTDGILVNASGAGGITNGINLVAANIVNAINVGENIILGTASAITFTEFNVSAATGSVTIDDSGNAGVFSVEGTVLDINDLTFVGAGTVTTAAGTNLTINSGTTGILAIGDDASNETVNISTGAAVKTLTVGSTNTTSATTIQSGSGDVAITSTDDFSMTITDAIAIDGAEFDVSGTTGSVTINDGGNAGVFSVEGTTLNITDLTFVGTGTIGTGAGALLSLNSGSGEVTTGPGDTIMIPAPPTAVNDALSDSPILTLRGTYDSQVGAGITSTTRDAIFIHNITSGLGAPGGQVEMDFAAAGTEFIFTDIGNMKSLGGVEFGDTTGFDVFDFLTANVSTADAMSLTADSLTTLDGFQLSLDALTGGRGIFMERADGAGNFTGAGLLAVSMLDTTSTGNAATFTSSGTGSALFLDKNGNTGSTINTTTGGALHIDNTSNTDYGLTVYGDSGTTTANSALAKFFNDNVGFDGYAVEIQSDALSASTTNGTALHILQEQVGETAGDGTSSTQALIIDVNEADPGVGTDDFDNAVILVRAINGVDNTKFRVDLDGDVHYDGMASTDAQDIAERYHSDQKLEPGDVVILNPEKDGIIKSTAPYQFGLVGGISTRPGVGLGPDDPDTFYLALKGRIPLKVIGENGPIHTGDAVTSSSTEGYGMKATQAGMIIGYAIEEFNGSGTGIIEVFVETEFYTGTVIGTDGSATLINDDTTVTSTGTATTTSTGFASNTLSLRGSGFDGTSSTDVQMSLVTDVTDASDYQLSIQNTSGTSVAYVSNEGDFALAGRLYPSDRGTLQTDKYIYYDGSTGLGGDFMRTNASGWATGSYDFAEMFPSTVPLTAGEVVVFGTDNESVTRSSTTQSAMLAGIVSTRPGFLAGENKDGHYPIALAGRVPTKVSLENGEIAIGDALTSSSTPGVAMKATKAGMIVGYALEPYTKTTSTTSSTLITFVNVSYWNGGETPALPGTDNRASTIIVTQNANNLTSLNMNGNIYMLGNDILGVSRIAGLSDRWSLEEDGTIISESVIKTVIESYQGERVETTAVTSPDVQITLVGTGTLQDGEAVIRFEDVSPSFNDVTGTTSPIRVIVTPNGPVSLYVYEKNNDGFGVRQINGSDSDVTFDWMVSAFRKDYEPVEEKVTEVVEVVEVVTESDPGIDNNLNDLNNLTNSVTTDPASPSSTDIQSDDSMESTSVDNEPAPTTE